MDIGSEKGFKVGDTGRIYYIVLIGEEKKPLPIYLAKFTVTRTLRKSSTAQIEGEIQGEVKVGYLVEVTVSPVMAKKKKPPTKVVKEILRPGQIWRDPYLDMEFVWVPEGCFAMGCGDWTDNCSESEGPLHKICMRGFWIGRYEATQAQWKKIMGSNPSAFKGCGDGCPVETVSWEEAVEFARRFSEKAGYIFRLPTEAEWEYACRSGGKKEKYSGGNNVDNVAWYRSNSEGLTHPVGRKRPNSLGIYDMSGNVWEWCMDIYDNDAYSKAKASLNNPVYMGDKYVDIYKQGYNTTLVILKRASGYRIVRGGSWGNFATRVRCSDRIRGEPDGRRDWLGFRLVRVMEKK